MGDQLRLFKLTPGEVEIKTRQLTDCWARLRALGQTLKDAQTRLRESDEASEVKGVREEIKACRDTADALLRELAGERT